MYIYIHTYIYIYIHTYTYTQTCIIGKLTPATSQPIIGIGPSGQRQSIQHGGIGRGTKAPKAHSLWNWISLEKTRKTRGKNVEKMWKKHGENVGKTRGTHGKHGKTYVEDMDKHGKNVDNNS